MKQRFRARELWLFAPFLLMSALTLCFGIAERACAQDASGVTISDVKIGTTSGLSQSHGWTRQITMKVSHSDPKPKWWGGWLSPRINLDPVDFDHPKFPPYDPASKNSIAGGSELIAGGGELLVKSGEKSVIWRPKDFSTNFSVDYDGTNYIFKHSLKNSELDKARGEITFRGIYRIADEAPFEVTSVIRRADEVLAPVPDKNTAGQLLSVDAVPFYRRTDTLINLTTVDYDECLVYFLVRRDTVKDKKNHYQRVQVHDLEVRDQEGKIYRDDKPEGFGFAYGAATYSTTEDPWRPFKGEQLRPDEALIFISVRIDPTTLTSGDLTLSGNVSIDSHWPIPFETKLLSRTLSKRGHAYDHDWTRPTNIVPIR